MRPKKEEIARAAAALRAGRLVVMPTETVYGLAASALNARALGRVFAAKGRPADNPLIVHVGSKAELARVAASVPALARKLVRAFWPGPLTVVVPAAPSLPRAVTAGLATVAVRMPAHPVALALIRAAGVPVAAPSANRSGRPSPTTVAHARGDLGCAVAVYLDGGPAEHGLESTVVDCTGPRPVVLRPGAITVEQIQRVCGDLAIGTRGADAPRSPGMKYRHYAPSARVWVIEGRATEARAGVQRTLGRLAAADRRAGVIAIGDERYAGAEVFRVPTLAALGRELYAIFREADARGLEDLVVRAVPERGLGRALMNRMRKAAER